MENILDLSVILPIKSSLVRDFSEYFTKAIQSINNQTIKAKELVIVHSSEESLINFLNDYDFGDLQVKKVLNKVNLDDTSGDNGYVTFGGVNSTLEDNEDDLATNKEIFYAIYNDFIPRTNKKGAGLGRFQVNMSPLGGENAANGAVTFRLPEEYLKKWKPDSNGEKVDGLSESVYQKILANDITIITDAEKLQNVSMYRNSYRTA